MHSTLVKVLLLAGLLATAIGQTTTTGGVACTSEASCTSGQCCGEFSGCTDSTGTAPTGTTDFCITASTGFTTFTGTYTATVSGTSTTYTCTGVMCMSATSAVCTPVTYDGSSGTTGQCSTTYGDTYCCQVSSTDGSDEYTDGVTGTCQEITTVTTSQDNGTSVTCGAIAKFASLFVVLAFQLF